MLRRRQMPGMVSSMVAGSGSWSRHALARAQIAADSFTPVSPVGGSHLHHDI